MTIQTVAETVALDGGFAVPASVTSSTERQYQELVSFANEVAADIARRADWSALHTAGTLTGTGTSAAIALPAAAERLATGSAVTRTDGTPVRPLTREEWTMTASQGTPRYYLLTNKTVLLWPYLANASTVNVRYISKNWCSNGTDAFASDTDTTLFPEVLLEKGLIAYWRRQKGRPYQEHEAEFEAAMAQYAQFDDRSRL